MVLNSLNLINESERNTGTPCYINSIGCLDKKGWYSINTRK